MRGKVHKKCIMYHVTGSPPPMRGKVWDAAPGAAAAGITPAYAGKRPITLHHIFKLEDHPRLCGEKDSRPIYLTNSQGSPPPMRGKVSHCATGKISKRITPAYAGKSLGVGVLWIHDEDHPRLCGEKQSDKMLRQCLEGSPPPMRGKDRGIQGIDPLGRITPAYAGKSWQLLFWAYYCRDHPRLCGEKLILSICGSFAQGSPPPMRGKEAG